MNLKKVAGIVLLCMVAVSVIYGFSVVLSTSLSSQTLDGQATRQPVLAQRPGGNIPKGDPIDNPKPN